MTQLLRTRLVKAGTGAATAGHDLVLVAAFRGQEPLAGADAARLPRPVVVAVRRAGERKGWKGEPGQSSAVPLGGKASTTVVVRGLGPKKELTRRGLAKWLAEALRAAASDGFRRPLLALPSHDVLSGVEGALFVLREIALTGYRFDEHLHKRRGARLRDTTVLPPPGQEESYQRGWNLAVKLAEGVGRARDLANTPPNVATPEWMSEQARALAAARGMKIDVLEVEQLEERGMGGLLAVGAGSVHPPRLVRLEWGEGERSVSLVGKGITFDSGGISIKPSAGMDEMKFDKCGACTVFGIAQAAADLDLPFRFRAYLALAENMPDGRAYRPSDIVRCYNGKTVEILNTDAEGRMVLADALAWAAEEKPDYLLDYATLTGACVVALGQHGAGVFTHQDDLANGLLASAGTMGEYLWRLPLWPEFDEDMKGLHGDLQNAGARWGGAATAAAFLANFVKGSKRWAHLDIAGPAYVGRGNKQAFGATGYGVSLTLHWLMKMAGHL